MNPGLGRPELIFVYGTLMRRAGHPMHRHLADGTRYLGTGIVAGELVMVAEYPGLVASNTAGSAVRGETYQILDPRVLRALDRYEGFDAGNPGESLFLRRRRPVELESGERVEAWVYLYNGQVEGLRRIDSGDYLGEIGT